MGELEPVYPLRKAVEIFFPGGDWTVSSLRTEIRKGRLKPMRIAGKLGVTESAIREMRRLCQESPSPPDSTSDHATTAARIGSSSIVDGSLAQDAARATVQELKERLRVTSPANMSRRKARSPSTSS